MQLRLEGVGLVDPSAPDGWPVTAEEAAAHDCEVMRRRRNRRVKGRSGKWADSPESLAWWKGRQRCRPTHQPTLSQSKAQTP